MLKHFYKKLTKPTAYLLIMGTALFSCAKKDAQEIPEEQILARVGDRIITADEFRYSFEFSFSPLRQGSNPRQVYLDYMIDELLLANEGYRLGLDKTPYVTKRLKRRRNNDLLEAFYKKYVHSRVNIPEEELQDAIKKGTVKFRMMIWPVPSLREANDVMAKASRSSLEDYVEQQIAKQEVKLDDKKFYETDWIDFLEMPPDIFDKIKDLEVGKVSEPFAYGQGYAVAQVLDIHLEGITDSQLLYGARRKKMEDRLHSIEADSIIKAVTDSIMTPLEVRVKGLIVEKLAPLLYQWFQDGLPQQRSIFRVLERAYDTDVSYVTEIYEMLDQVLVVCQDRQVLVEDYLHYMDYYRSNLKKSQSLDDFYNRLILEIGQMLRSDAFLDIAEQDGYADSAYIVNDLKLWEQKWTYDRYRHEVVKEIEVSENEMSEFFKYRWRELDIANTDTTNLDKYKKDVYNAVLHEKQMEQLEIKLKKLREKYAVWINKELLDQIELNDDPKSSQISLFVRKTFSKESLVPVVDPKWKNLN